MDTHIAVDSKLELTIAELIEGIIYFSLGLLFGYYISNPRDAIHI